MKTIILMILSMLAIDPAPVPEDVPVAYDPNLCPSDPFAWIVTETGTSIEYTFVVVSAGGVDVNDVNFTEAEVDVENITWMKIILQGKADFKFQDIIDGETVWVQPISLFWTPFQPGVRYINIRVTNDWGYTDDRTLLVVVRRPDQPYIYPIDRLVITTVRQRNSLWQWAKKRLISRSYPTNVWN